MQIAQNLLDDLPASLPQELVQNLLSTRDIRIERIVSHGHCSAEGFWYEQSTAEWVLVVAGRARVRFESGQLIEMTTGSFINIAAHQKHRVEWTDPHEHTVWLALHYQSGSEARGPADRR